VGQNESLRGRARTHLFPDRPNDAHPVHRVARDVDEREPALEVVRREGVVARGEVVARDRRRDVFGAVAGGDEDGPVADCELGGEGRGKEGVCAARCRASGSRARAEGTDASDSQGTNEVNTFALDLCSVVLEFSYAASCERISCSEWIASQHRCIAYSLEPM
jgi:hypothetical protein